MSEEMKTISQPPPAPFPTMFVHVCTVKMQSFSRIERLSRPQTNIPCSSNPFSQSKDASDYSADELKNQKVIIKLGLTESRV